MKPLLFLGMILISTLTCAQTDRIPLDFRKAFEGTWQHNQKYGTNTVRIRFEAGKDYALFTDIGNGMAPAVTLKAIPKGDLLVIPAKQNENDYLELQIVKGKLHLKGMPVSWDENGKELKDNNQPGRHVVYKRVKDTENTP